MANTFELIASYTASGSVASIDFTSIPSTYTDLCVKFSIRTDAAINGMQISFNGVTTNRTIRRLYGDGSSAASDNYSSMGIYVDASSYTSNTFGNGEFYIPNYAGSANKSLSIDTVAENNATAAPMVLAAGLWSSSAAITSIKLQPDSAVNIVQYSTAYLYGVKNA